MKELPIEILIVEDNPDDLFFIKKVVDKDRFNCTFISSGREAFQYLSSGLFEPDIVLLDNMLPEMNGLEILENLNNEGKEYSYIFLTIDNSIKTVVEAMKLGALDFVVKSSTLKNDLPPIIDKVYKINKNRIEKKRIEMELIEAKNIAEENAVKYQTLVDAAFDSIIITEKGIILEVNKRATEISGYSYEELIGRKAMDLTLTGGEEINRYIKYHDGRDIDTKVRKKDGTILSVIINSRESVINNSHVRITSIHDITESRLMEKKLRQSEKMSAIGQLAGGIAHDFNNQLSPIIGYADMLCHQLEKPQDIKFAQNILRSAIRSADLIKKLLSFARKGQINLEQINVEDLLNYSIDLFEKGSDKNITVLKEYLQTDLIVSADSNQLEHAILNILINGRDAMADGGAITVKTESIDIDSDHELYIYSHLDVGPYVKISVKDTGTGIPDELKKKIFEPFFTTKEVGKGTGMGLASAYGAIKEHGGYITFSSIEGTGSEFYIYLPFEIDLPGVQKDIEEVEADKAVKSRIMVVDDEELLRSMVEDILKKDNHIIESCSNGREALKLFKNTNMSFDLILLDMDMPELGGLGTFMKMKELDPDVKVVISSGYNMRKEFKKLKDEGVVGFIYKPYKINQLRKQLKNILG